MCFVSRASVRRAGSRSARYLPARMRLPSQSAVLPERSDLREAQQAKSKTRDRKDADGQQVTVLRLRKPSNASACFAQDDKLRLSPGAPNRLGHLTGVGA